MRNSHFVNSSILYNTFLMSSPSEIVEMASKKKIRPGIRNLVLDICCCDDTGEDVDVPYIKYRFR